MPPEASRTTGQESEQGEEGRMCVNAQASVRSTGFGVRQTWAPVLGLTRGVTLDKSLNFPFS